MASRTTRFGPVPRRRSRTFHLLAGGPDAAAGEVREPELPFGAVEAIPGGYRRRTSDDYDRHLCLIPRDVLDFVLATRPKTWQRLRKHHGAEVKERFLKRLAREVTAPRPR